MKVTIHTKNGKQTREIKPEDARFYEELPFTSENVIATEIEE